MAESEPIEVAIIGGGCAAMATAFELTRPCHAGRFQVTVYQLGWRLGGKGASGRGVAGRIEEHGLHVWLGFYENAFRLMRECYEELGRDPLTCPIADWTDAFHPDARVGLADFTPGGLERWVSHFPPRAGLPGDPLAGDQPFTLLAYARQSVTLLRLLLLSARTGGDEPLPAAEPPKGEGLIEQARRLLGLGRLATQAALLEALRLLDALLPALPGPAVDAALRLIDGLGEGIRRRLDRLVAGDDELRRPWEIADLVLATLRGVLRFGLLTDPRGLDAIDDYDCRTWLRLNGAAPESVDSAFVRGLYDLALAYRGGDGERPAVAAGSGLRGLLRMFFTYRGALFWKMQAGMGDIVFAPFYEVLRRRGVRFEFFHRLDHIRLADDGASPHVSALEMSVQARVKGDQYEPLVDVGGLPCWPASPDYSQLVDGDRWRRDGRDFEDHWDERRVERKTLEVGRDFDFVALAVGFGAIPHVCRDLIERDTRWREMVDKVETVATQAFQVWMKEDMEMLGWRDPPGSLAAYVQPFDTWADMSHLAPAELWPEEPRSIAYFCSVLRTGAEAAGGRPEDVDARAEHERVRAHAIRFLDRDVGRLWPAAGAPDGGFRWSLLLDPPADPDAAHQDEDGADRHHFDSQFWTANVNPTDRYVLSLPGTLRCRISPLDPTYDNLTVAGDWTANGHNEACVESAVMSGRLAAHALSGSPPLEAIIGYDHP